MELLSKAALMASEYLADLKTRRVFPTSEVLGRSRSLAAALPDDPTDAAAVLDLLNRLGSPATVASAGGRYFGLVIGGSLPAALAANWLASSWDQNAFSVTTSPAAAAIEEIAAGWLTDLFGLAPDCGVGFVTGATMANFAGLAAARHTLLARAGWNVEEQGLLGAPSLDVIVSDEVHVAVLKALSMLGLGSRRVTRVPVDNQGRMRIDRLPAFGDSTLLCVQAGNVNTGAFDPINEIVMRAKQARAWVHVDGAFGLWAAAVPGLAHLTAGLAGVDSMATDGHKWLNVPYDSGLVLVKDSTALRAAMSIHAPYLASSDAREPGQFTPDSSRRARGVDIWAALLSLGRRGLIEMIERTCRHARRFAEGLRAAGFAILNDVVLNQVLVSFGDAATTNRIIKAIQDDGTCWCGGTQWQGHAAMRISVSSWATTDEDVDTSLEAMLRLARQ